MDFVNLIITVFPFVATIAVMWVAFKLVMAAGLYLAYRVFGWRPRIYWKAVAVKTAELVSKQYCLEKAAACESDGHTVPDEMKDEMQVEMEAFANWVIEEYTLRYAVIGTVR
jgi:hypothetical protein